MQLMARLGKSWWLTEDGDQSQALQTIRRQTSDCGLRASQRGEPGRRHPPESAPDKAGDVTNGQVGVPFGNQAT